MPESLKPSLSTPWLFVYMLLVNGQINSPSLDILTIQTGKQVHTRGQIFCRIPAYEGTYNIIILLDTITIRKLKQPRRQGKHHLKK